MLSNSSLLGSFDEDWDDASDNSFDEEVLSEGSGSFFD